MRLIDDDREFRVLSTPSPSSPRSSAIRDLMMTINTMNGNVEYVDQTTRTNNAAPQTEGALKAESAYEWELKNLPIRTIAHWTKASVQILADAPQLL